MKYKRFSYRMPFHLSYPYFEGRNLEVKGELGFVYLHLASSGEERMTENRHRLGMPCPTAALTLLLPNSLVETREIGKILQPHALKLLMGRMQLHPVLETTKVSFTLSNYCSPLLSGG